MKNPVDTTSKIIRYEGGTARSIQDTIVTEYAVTIQLDGEEFATMVCTPEYIEDMVIGFLASEGVIREYSDIKEIWVQDDGFVNVETKKANKLSRKFHSKRYITSCCGKSRQGFYFYNDARTAKKITEVGIRLPIASCFRLMNDMQAEAETFHATGGVHNAALCDENGIILSRMDIGRHNALDKIYGYCLKNNISVKGKIIAFSGRISSEILLKVAKIGCEVVLSKSAPTQLALQLADDLGITAVGFIRNSSCNIYTHPERIET